MPDKDLVAAINTYCYLADVARSPALKNKYVKRAEEVQEELDLLKAQTHER